MANGGVGGLLSAATDTQISNAQTDDLLVVNGSTRWANVPIAGKVALATKGGLEKMSPTTGSNIAVDLNAGNVHYRTLSGAGTTATFIINNIPAHVGSAVSFTLYVEQGATLKTTVNWSSNVPVKWAGGTAPTLTQSVGAVDVFVFEKIDGVTEWFGSLVGAAFA